MLATAIRTATAADNPAVASALATRPAGGGDLAALDRIGTVISLPRDQALFGEGDPADYFYKVLAGAARSCRMLADGRRHIAEFLLPGDFVGIEAAGTHHSTAEAVTDTTLMRYSRPALDRLVQQQPRLGRSLLGLICGELYAAQAQLLLLGRKNAVERLASFLLAMAERSGEADRVLLPMTRCDIADHLGLTTETVSRIFSQLKSQGVIRLGAGSEVELKDRDELEALAEAA
ncbi:MAG TPA: helix-turn-helix domain-containing protein [Stellaceae bacterium]|nr:helix-turn-helix domain-containing protein [Stellaceae bacterium]